MSVLAITPAVLAGAAVFLAYSDKPGWGWFLFVALLMTWAVTDSGNP